MYSSLIFVVPQVLPDFMHVHMLLMHAVVWHVHFSYSLGKQQPVQVEVKTISDIEKDYSLVRTKLNLLRMDPSMANQIYSQLGLCMK